MVTQPHKRQRRAYIKSPLNKISLQQQLSLFLALVQRDLTVMYKRSLLGVAWMLIKPLMQLSVFSIVFGLLLPTRTEDFVPFLFLGIITWTWFGGSLNAATGSIVGSRALLRQPNFPVMILPIVPIGSGLVHFCVSLPIVFVIGAGASLTPLLAVLPLVMLVQVLLLVGLAYLMAALNVRFRDTKHTLGILLQMLMYLSGIFYNYQSLPEQYQRWFFLNPVVHVVTAYRHILIGGNEPQWLFLTIVGLVSLSLIPVGYGLFKQQSYRFIEEL